MPRVAVAVLEAEPALAEVHLAGDARRFHPGQRAIHRGPADPLVLLADQVDEVVGGEMALLAQEDVDDAVALARPLAAGRPQAVDVGCRGLL